jgi:SAM-dependent methyltransferase
MQKLIRRLLRLESLKAPEDFTSEAESGSNFLDARYVGLIDAKLSGWYLTESNELFRGIHISESDVVVDVGCGEGGSISYCGNLGAHIIGIDKDEDALRRAIECTRDSKARVKEFHIAQAEHLPLPDGFATRVLCTEVLEHVEDPSVVLAELFRIGMPGSLYLITVPDYLAEKMQQHVAPICYFQHPNHIRIIDREEFKCLVENAGLKIISHTNYGFFWSIWWALFWGCETNVDNQNGSALNHWTQAWSKLLETSKGRQLQEKLNAFMPKSQVIVALKSE